MLPSFVPYPAIADIPPQPASASLTPPPGSTSSAGPSITPSLKQARPLEEILSSWRTLVQEREQDRKKTAMTVTPRPAPATKASASSPSAEPAGQPKTPPELLLREDRAGQEQLTQLLYQTYACQTTYGDKAQMMEYRDQMFQAMLGQYSIRQVREAFRQHVLSSSNLPTIHDIARHIDPSLEPLSAAVYTRISQKIRDGSQWVSAEERRYLQRFEAQELRKVGRQ